MAWSFPATCILNSVSCDVRPVNVPRPSLRVPWVPVPGAGRVSCMGPRPVSCSMGPGACVMGPDTVVCATASGSCAVVSCSCPDPPVSRFPGTCVLYVRRVLGPGCRGLCRTRLMWLVLGYRPPGPALCCHGCVRDPGSSRSWFPAPCISVLASNIRGPGLVSRVPGTGACVIGVCYRHFCYGFRFPELVSGIAGSAGNTHP